MFVVQHQTPLIVTVKPTCMLQRAQLGNETLVFPVWLSAGCCHVTCVWAPAPPLHGQTKHNRIFQTSSHGSNYPVNSVQASRNTPPPHSRAVAQQLQVCLVGPLTSLNRHRVCVPSLVYVSTAEKNPGLNKSSLMPSDTQPGQRVSS